jgi:8-oxo-dGTP pyrophosphatase MutT (NUDIX family)
METSETSLACAHRELDEETGIDLSSTRVHQIGYKKFSKEGAGYFIYEFSNEPHLIPKDRQEISECGWFNEGEMRQMPCNRDVNSFLLAMGRKP